MSGTVIWFTGLSGAGKTTVSSALEAHLRAKGIPFEVLDGDIVRENLSKGLGFSKEDRDTNVRRIGFVANLLARHGITVLVSAISPYRAVRDEVLAVSPTKLEVFVDAPLRVCAERDVKGLYAKAISGEIPNFTGVSDPYEPPLTPDVHLRTDLITVEEGVQHVLAALESLREPVLA
jgi:adenylylsulfate kinase